MTSMGVLAMPPFALHSPHSHSHRHHHPYNSLQQQQHYLSPGTQQQQGAHSTRHHSFPCASTPSSDHFQLFQQQQQQLQLSNRNGHYSSSSSSNADAQTPTQSQQQQLLQAPLQQQNTATNTTNTPAAEQPHPSSSVSPSISTVSTTYFTMDNTDTTPMIDVDQQDIVGGSSNAPSPLSGNNNAAYPSSSSSIWSNADGLLSHRTLTVPGENNINHNTCKFF
ncbi:MAG: hypothetical protein J3R72DRAFT_437718, partial [Linnemannia gamsii]